MKKNPALLYKTLVVGVIVLFIGVGMQPAFVVDTDIESAYKSIECSIKINSSSVQLPYEGLFVDQAVDSDCYGSGGSNQIYSYMPIGQSFKPLFECHYGIELYIRDSNPQSPPAPIQIWLKENTINGSIVPGTNVTLNLTSGSGWRFFEFSSPVNLTINETYVIDISTTISKWGIRGTSGNCYQRGISYFYGAPSPSWDFYFRTYVLSYPIANFTYSAEESPVLFNGSSSYDLDGEIVSYEWDFGDGIIGAGEITYHKYCEVGTYDVTLTITDDDGLTDNITKCIDVVIADTPPELEINGPNSGRPGVEYEYVFNVIDPDPYEFYLWIDWGDGDSTGWIGIYLRGVPVKHSHIWNETGTYTIKAKVRDYCGESGWATFEVEIPRTRASSYQWLFERFPLLEKLLTFLLL
jgi:PKD repeat protein